MKGSKPELNCEAVDEMEMIERYLKEDLTEAEAETFERHYFQCDRCFSRMQIQHALAVELGSQGDLSSYCSTATTSSKNWWMNYKTWGLAAAAMLILLLIPLSYWWVVSTRPADTVLSQLARVDEVPPYLPGAIRGGETNPAALSFSDGMECYSAKEYEKAIPLLEKARRLDPSHVPATFYLGISYLITQRLQDAIQTLTRVLELGPNSYEEEAHWFLAKAYFQKGEWKRGQAELEEVISMKGMYFEDA
ncbi:MAG: tetratricopeptide repeat protein, partial [bacterium]